MGMTGLFRMAVVTAVTVMACGTADAQRWRYRPHRVVTVVAKPVVTTSVVNRFTQENRLGMAMSYIKKHGCLTVRKYAKMTKLPKDAAQAELDAFAADSGNPVTAAVRGKKKVYVLRRGA